MSNDENKSLQQNLPLSWEEDSDNNLEEQAPPKKLLLKREEPEADSFQNEFEADPVPAPQAPRPLLLKKAPEEPQLKSEEDYRKVQDNLDTIYDKEIPIESQDLDDEDYDEEWQDEASDLEEESSELENETDSFGVIENDLDDDFSLGAAEDKEPETENNQEEEQPDTGQETDLRENDEDSLASDLPEEDSIDSDSEDDEFEDDDSKYGNVEDDDSEDKYASAFEDSGTFTLDESTDDDEKVPLFEEDDIEENRLEISEEGQISKKLEEGDEEPAESEEELHEESEEEKQLSPEESVFALKADTYYEVQTELKSESEEVDTSDSTLSEVIQDYEVQSLGSLLQEARLSCSFTIKDAAEATRIKSSYIIALENNEMDELPAKVYILNYIRQLCREYNVPNEPMIDAFERQSESKNSGSDVKIMRVGDEDARKATKPNSKLNALVIGSSLLTLVMLFLIGWYMRWINPVATPDTIKIEINLEDVRPEVKLPAPELPIPSQ